MAVVIVSREDTNLSGREVDEFYRKIEDLSNRVSTLASTIAVMSERIRATEETIEKVEKETSGLNRLANRGMGIMIALALIGGAFGGFWERLIRLVGH